MKNVTGKFFGNPSNTAQLTSPFSSYLMVPSNNSDGFVKYDFLLQNQCCVFSNIFSQYLSVPFFIIVYCYFVQDRCPPLLTCSFTHFYPTLSKKKTKKYCCGFTFPTFRSSILCSHCRQCFISNPQEILRCAEFYCFYRTVLEDPDMGEEITEHLMHCQNYL